MSEEQLSSADRPATSADVARLAGVSRTTVSFILNDVRDQKISESTREAVLQAARELDYQPNRTARDLASGVSATLLCFVPRTHLNEGALGLLSELTAELSRRGYTLAVYFDSPDRAVLPQLVRGLRPRMLFPLYGDIPAWVADAVASTIEILPTSSGGTAPTDAGSIAQVSYLAAHGHRRLGFVGIADEALASIIDRRRRTVEVQAGLLDGGSAQSRLLREDGADADAVVAQFVTAGVTAICCFNDEIALMILGAMKRANVACPSDLAVIGYDAVPVGAWTDPPLTTVAWDPRAAAVAYAEGIVAMLDPAHAVDTSDIEQTLGVQIVPRHSA